MSFLSFNRNICGGLRGVSLTDKYKIPLSLLYSNGHSWSITPRMIAKIMQALKLLLLVRDMLKTSLGRLA